METRWLKVNLVINTCYMNVNTIWRLKCILLKLLSQLFSISFASNTFNALILLLIYNQRIHIILYALLRKSNHTQLTHQVPRQIILQNISRNRPIFPLLDKKNDGLTTRLSSWLTVLWSLFSTPIMIQWQLEGSWYLLGIKKRDVLGLIWRHLVVDGQIKIAYGFRTDANQHKWH